MNEKAARKIVKERSGGDCELRIKDVCRGRATNFQHRRAQKHAGPWVPSNGLDVCGMGNVSGCHGFIHQHPALAEKYGWTVKSWDDWDGKPVRLWHGVVLLDDAGGWTNLGDGKHTAGCAVWTSNECDCDEEET